MKENCSHGNGNLTGAGLSTRMKSRVGDLVFNIYHERLPYEVVTNIIQCCISAVVTIFRVIFKRLSLY